MLSISIINALPVIKYTVNTICTFFSFHDTYGISHCQLAQLAPKAWLKALRIDGSICSGQALSHRYFHSSNFYNNWSSSFHTPEQNPHPEKWKTSLLTIKVSRMAIIPNYIKTNIDLFLRQFSEQPSPVASPAAVV